jgi:hypothetical protein
MAKKFMYVCLGILALAAAYHLGAESACSTLANRAVMFSMDQGGFYVMTDTGEIWGYSHSSGVWTHLVTWPYDPPTQTRQGTWGQIKAEFGE